MPEDVVIAGAGPAGLLLAIELSLAGVRPLVLEALPERLPHNRANGLVGQVVRMLDRRGLYERLAGTAGPPVPTPRYMFGGLPLDLTDLPDEDNPLYLLPVPQRQIEDVLEARARELGVEIRFGHRLTGLIRTDDGVLVRVDGPDGGYELAAGYLVGADGGHSATRKLAGIDFPGVSRDDTVSRSAHVRVPDELRDPATGGLRVPGHGTIPPFLYHRTERGLFVYAPFPGRPTAVTTMEWNALDTTGEFDLAELRASVRRVLGVDVALAPPAGPGPHLLRRLVGGNTRIAETYRSGRVLLVGDAAHVHAAVGGPGLNLGLQDAVNLGWKLAAAVRGRDDLLDSYQAERRPVGARVVTHTQAQSALITAGPQTTALRSVLTELLADRPARHRLAELLAGADTRYPAEPGAHPLVGRWAPDLVLRRATGPLPGSSTGPASGEAAGSRAGGVPGAAAAPGPDAGAAPVRLAELTAAGRPLLLDLTTGHDLGRELADLAGRVDVVTAAPVAGAPTAMLLRPDCYLAWASDSANPDPAERAALCAAAGRWFAARRLVEPVA
ncbi:FAD-dependent oxidoreductase [Actinocatenispora thailandica]|uniref:FAD-dependent oxidoreductase n=1 Tax=Actinocatenispora thailandica TaxID=227318 RepID=A0A7R7HXM8_9ACTN|nr:FAD-dependent monooxygenase [Actinocatenispora thailandica]BCJ35901.1 FAD-dependent oxidoreductase [Actinocatenispora thailandica]